MSEIEVKNIKEAQEKLAEMEDASLNKPTESEINEATKDFNAKAAEFNSKKFKIGKPKQADEIFDFVINFMENHVYWTKNGWMGVLKMHEELSEAKKNKKKGEAFAVGYQALEFMFYALTNPGGTGIESARAVLPVLLPGEPAFQHADTGVQPPAPSEPRYSHVSTQRQPPRTSRGGTPNHWTRPRIQENSSRGTATSAI